MWDFWWTKWHSDKLFPEYFGSPLQQSIADAGGQAV
jgi:hypothetical protein